MLFYTYTFPGMYPGGLAGLVDSVTPLESGGDRVCFRSDDGWRYSTYYSDIPTYRTVVLVCPD